VRNCNALTVPLDRVAPRSHDHAKIEWHNVKVSVALSTAATLMTNRPSVSLVAFWLVLPLLIVYYAKSGLAALFSRNIDVSALLNEYGN
jgi:hypothetical protein